VRPEGLHQWKITITPSEIEPATFRLVVQCLNQLRLRLPTNYRQHKCTRQHFRFLNIEPYSRHVYYKIA
jgi:hypothetical protein